MARIYGLGHPARLTSTARGSQAGGESLAPSEEDYEWVNRPLELSLGIQPIPACATLNIFEISRGVISSVI